MENAMAESTLPENIDVEFVNNLLLQIRDRQYKYSMWNKFKTKYFIWNKTKAT